MGKINIFENYEELKPVEKVEVVEPTERNQKFREVYICDVTKELGLSCQYKDNMDKLQEVMTKMRSSLNESPPLEGAFKPKRNELCCCRFSEDGLWYRAKIEKNAPCSTWITEIEKKSHHRNWRNSHPSSTSRCWHRRRTSTSWRWCSLLKMRTRWWRLTTDCAANWERRSARSTSSTRTGLIT